MKYITLIKRENEDWEIGHDITNNLDEHIKFKKEMLECTDVDEVKIMKVEEIEIDL